MTEARRIEFLGHPLDVFTMEQTVDRVEELVRAKKPSQHCVLNANKIFLMKEDKALCDIVHRCDIVQADGISVVWAARFLSLPTFPRVTGIDLMERLLEEAPKKNFRIFFLGGTDEVVEKLISVVQKRYPGLIVAGYRNGYFSEDDSDDVVKNIAESNADILFVGMSSPRKEVWINRNLSQLNVPFCIGVGGSFDVVVGKVKRAPRWAQCLGLEWLVRLLQEPRRLWRRYLVSLSYFAGAVLFEFFKSKKSRNGRKSA